MREVTDEMARKAVKIYARLTNKIISENQIMRMKEALEAVFAMQYHIEDKLKKVEAPHLGNCCKYKTEQEPKKQTLFDIVMKSYPKVEDRINIGVCGALNCLSQYLEQSK